MIRVRCSICVEAACANLSKDSETEAYEKAIASIPTIQSSILSRNREEGMKLLINEMIRHLEMAHPKELPYLAAVGAQFNGFNIMNRFQTRNPESLFETEKEIVRDRLCEEIMKYSPDEEDEEMSEEEEEAAAKEIGGYLKEAEAIKEEAEPSQNETAKILAEGI